VVAAGSRAFTTNDNPDRERRIAMKTTIAAVAALLVGHAAVAGAAACEDAATGRKLSGAARTSFVKKCDEDATAACETRATDRKLSGAARTSFVKKCVEDGAGLTTDNAAAACETKAAAKKLAGAAHDSFVKKCVADAVGAAQ
jgi:hypothetical protein